MDNLAVKTLSTNNKAWWWFGDDVELHDVLGGEFYFKF